MSGTQTHTPGPWEVLLHRFEAKRPFYKVAAGDEVVTVADVPQHPLDPWNAEANARLIAAAPEMLEALKEARDLLAKLQGPKASEWIAPNELETMAAEDTACKMLEAIAKAEGGAS